MALLDDIFGPGTLQAPGGQIVDLTDPEAVRRLVEAMPTTMLNVPGAVTTGDMLRRADAQPAPITTEALQPSVRAGTPYTPPAASAQPAAVAPRSAAPAPQIDPMERLGAVLQGLGDRNQGLIARIGGALSAGPQFDRARQTENLTVKALMDRGLDQDAATAAARTPAIIPTLLGPKATDWVFSPQAGTDKYGNHLPGFVNPRTQEIHLVGAGQPGQGTQTGARPGGGDITGLTGQALLDALDPGDRAQVQAILEGRQAPPSPNSRTQRTQRIMEWVAQADPMFDMTNYKARAAANMEFAQNRPGTAGGNITALETAMGHLQNLSQRAAALNNNSLPLSTAVRTVTNPMARGMEGLSGFRDRETQFNIDRKAALDEAAKVFAGSNSTVFDRKAWEDKLDPTLPSETLQAGVRELVTLMKSRLDSLVGSYNRTMNTDRDPYSFMKPDRAALMQRFLGEQPAATSGAPGARAGAAAGTAPALPSGLPAGSMYSPSRQQWRDPQGNIYDLQGRRLGT